MIGSFNLSAGSLRININRALLPSKGQQGQPLPTNTVSRRQSPRDSRYLYQKSAFLTENTSLTLKQIFACDLITFMNCGAASEKQCSAAITSHFHPASSFR